MRDKFLNLNISGSKNQRKQILSLLSVFFLIYKNA